MATDSHQNWLMQPDCLEQLKVFLSDKNKYFYYEKNQGLKFCSHIQIPKNDAAQVLNELTKNNSIMNPADHEKVMEYLMKINEEILNEKERKKKFIVEQEMMKVLRKYMKHFRSNVKQSSLRQKTQGESIYFERASIEVLKKKKKRVVNEKISKDYGMEKIENTKSNSNESVKFMTLERKLKELKENNAEKFNKVMKKCENIKKNEYAYY